MESKPSYQIEMVRTTTQFTKLKLLHEIKFKTTNRSDSNRTSSIIVLMKGGNMVKVK